MCNSNDKGLVYADWTFWREGLDSLLKTERPWYNTKLHPMVRLKYCRSEKCGVLLHCQYFYIHSNCSTSCLLSISLIDLFKIKGFWTIFFIFIVFSTTFRPICPPAFFRCLSNSGTFTELWTTSFIESTGFTCSDSVSHNRVHVLNIPVFLLACSQDWTCNLQMMVHHIRPFNLTSYYCHIWKEKGNHLPLKLK